MDVIVLAAGLITEIAAALVVIWKVLSWLRKLSESEKCQLRQNMLHTYYTNRETKQIRQYEFENFEISYAAYKALNGNSFIDKIYKEVHGWEVIT